MTTAKEMKRMDEETRKKAQAIFERLGLTEEQAVELFYKRTIAAGKMPFAAAEGKPRKSRKTHERTLRRMGCFLADRRSSIRAAISACLCRADCVEKPRQSSAMPAFFSLPARQIRRGYDHVIELLRSVVARGNHPALHMVPYRTMPYAEAL